MSQDDDLPNTLTPPVHSSQSQPSQEDKVNLVNEIPWGRLISCIKCLHSIDLVQPVTFGRGSSCDVIVPMKECPIRLLPNVSKKHFTIERDLEDNLVYITDFSKNGTFINKEKIGRNKKKILINEDEIAVATPHQIIYKFLSHSNEKNDFLPAALLGKFADVRRLGRGACGEVRLVKHRSTLKEYAVKKITLSESNSSQMHRINHPSRVENEIKILENLSHPLIISMHDILSLDKEVYLVLEYMAGGELTSRIHPKLMSLDTAKFFFMQMVLATNYLHSCNVMHRDLKPDNILLRDNREQSLIKISDFGLSKITEESAKTTCGTLRFAAPEVINTDYRDYGEYGKEADIWSLGVILYYMVSQEFPFQGNDTSQLAKNIVRGNYGFYGPIWHDEDMAPVKDLLRKILLLDARNRFDARQIMDHEWLKYDHGVKHKVTKLLELEGLDPIEIFRWSRKRKNSDLDHSDNTLTSIDGSLTCNSSTTLCC